MAMSFQLDRDQALTAVSEFVEVYRRKPVADNMFGAYETRVTAAVTAQDPKHLRQEFSRVLYLQADADGRKRHRLAFREVVYFKLKGSMEAGGPSVEPS